MQTRKWKKLVRILDASVWLLLKLTDILGPILSSLLGGGLALLTYYLLIPRIGILPTTLAMLLIGIAITSSYQRIAKQIKLKRYGNQLENIYVRSRHPKDRSLVKRQEVHKDWLKWSGNKHQVQVKIILYQDHHHPNETWEEYEARFVEEVKADRVLRYGQLYSDQGEQWFLKHMAHQEGIILSTEETIPS